MLYNSYFHFFLFRLQPMFRWRYFVSFSLNHYHRGIFKSGVLCILCRYFINKVHKNICLYLKLIFHCHKTVLISIVFLRVLQKHQLVYFLTIFLSFTLHKLLVFVFRIINSPLINSIKTNSWIRHTTFIHQSWI